MTERLFDADSYTECFTACVLSCALTGDKFEVILDRTAFFPEGGGQSSDTGYIEDVFVSHVYEKDGTIYHVTDTPLPLGDVRCKIDFKERFRKMQNHTGEHIFSGIVHRDYGFNNVGFHLSDEYVRVDFDGVLDKCSIRKLEEETNYAVVENRQIKAWYPNEEELVQMDYRSKIDIRQNVRIVEIEGVDRCACCAPHVRRTGEVGVVKIVDFMKYKGGTRLFMACGSDALRLFIDEHSVLSESAAQLSLKREEVGEAVRKMQSEISHLRHELSAEKLRAIKPMLEGTKYTEGNLCFFFEGADMQWMRAFANEAVKKCGGAAGVFSAEADGYKYIIASERVDLKEKSREINGKLCGRGGGTSAMIQGGCTAERDEIENYFTSVRF